MTILKNFKNVMRNCEVGSLCFPGPRVPDGWNTLPCQHRRTRADRTGGKLGFANQYELWSYWSDRSHWEWGKLLQTFEQSTFFVLNKARIHHVCFSNERLQTADKSSVSLELYSFPPAADLTQRLNVTEMSLYPEIHNVSPGTIWLPTTQNCEPSVCPA